MIKGSDFAATALKGVFPSGGHVLIDNFRIVETDAPPTAECPPNYALYSGDYKASLNLNGYTLKGVLLDGAEIKYAFENGVLTLSGGVMDDAGAGTHKMTVITSFVCLEREITITDSSLIAELSDTSVTYRSGDGSRKLYGTFSEGVSAVGLKQVEKTVTGNTDKDFYGSNTEKNYAQESFMLLVDGLDGTGYIQLEQAFLDCFFGETDFVLSVSNGAKLRFTLNTDSIFFSDYDNSTIYSPTPWTEITSGLNGVHSVKDYDGNGNKGFYLSSLSQSVDPSVFTIKHGAYGKWGWFVADPLKSDGDSYTVSFDYRVFGINTVNLYLYASEDALPAVVPLAVAATADEALKTYTGTFTASELQLFKIAVENNFEEGSAHVLFDNFRIIKSGAPAQGLRSAANIGTGG